MSIPPAPVARLGWWDALVMNVVELQDVTKTFGATVAVNGLSLSVPPGSIYGFIGPNGSGKTTTLRLILNFFYADRGSVRVFGKEAGGGTSDRIGYLPEERGLYRRMKVREFLRFYAGLKGGNAVTAAVDAWLQRLELADAANKKIEALSKGMSQRVQFIAAVAAKPDLLILDEPFSGLDPVNADVLRQAVLELRAQGATVIFSTHDMAVAERMCDFICMIFQGRKVLDGTLAAIQDRYGEDTLRVRAEGGAERLRGLEGVEAVDDFGQVQVLRLARDRDPQQVIGAVLARTRVQSFEIARPSLHDIFVRIATGKEAPHA